MYILKNLAIKALFSKEKIYTNLVKPITPIKYNSFKYGLFFINNASRIITKVHFKNKNQEIIELFKYIERMQI